MNEKKIIDELREFVSAVKAMTQRGVGTMAHLDLLLEDKLTELEQKYCSEHQSEQIKKPKFKTDDRVKETNSDIVFKVIGIEFEPPYHWRYLIKGEDDEYCVGESYESELELVEEPQAEGNIITKNEGEEK